MAVVSDQIIHGTNIFDKDPILTGAEVVNATPLFAPWQGPGEVFYKIRKNAVAPRHFLDSADQGTIGVRFVMIPVNDQRTRVRIDADLRGDLPITATTSPMARWKKAKWGK